MQTMPCPWEPLLILILPTAPTLSFLYFFPPTPAGDHDPFRQTGRSFQAVHLPSSHLVAFEAVVSLLFFSPLVPFFRLPACPLFQPLTTPSGPPSSASLFPQCMPHTSIGRGFGSYADDVCVAAASSVSFQCSVTPTMTGTLWIDRFTRCLCVLDHADGRTYLTHSFCSFRWEYYGQYRETLKPTLGSHNLLPPTGCWRPLIPSARAISSTIT